MGWFEGKVAIVTGAASGIGQATAQRLADDGANVIAADVDAKGLKWADDYGSVTACPGDVRSEESNAAMVELATARHGRLDALILNAGVADTGPIQEADLTQFDRLIEVNLRGVVLGLIAAIPALKRDGGGAVVITSSVSGLRGDFGLWAYDAAKGGVSNLVRSAALDLARDGIRVNGVCPGPILTGITLPVIQEDPESMEEMRQQVPLKRFAEPSEVASVIAFLASPEASFMTGTLLPVDGGVTANTGLIRPPHAA
jgi:NAD(P)-dependent dehydrogenase (short-subunit alcohol dehydrogenase family)